MAKTITVLETFKSAPIPPSSLRSASILRLTLGFVILLGSMVTTLGVSWDIQWHSFVGRDRTLIPPHEMMLGGILLSGVVALATVLMETMWARRNLLPASYSTSFNGLFHSPLGAYIAGFGALDAAIGFPLDAYWHSLYGIDVSIWAPFHIMILVGAAVVPLGAAYMLLSAAHLAEQGQRGIVRAGNLGAVLAFSTLLSISTYLMVSATGDQGFLTLGNTLAVNVFPLLYGLTLALLLVAAIHAIPGRWTATLVIGGYLLYGILFSIFVPPATNALVLSEHLSYRRDLAAFAYLSIVVMQGWFLVPVLVAPLLDTVFHQAQHKSWSLTRQLLVFSSISLLACVPVVPILPAFFVLIANELGAVNTVLSLLLGLVGTLTGTWLGQRLGYSMQYAERGA
jgi:hypothetical protein